MVADIPYLNVVESPRACEWTDDYFSNKVAFAHIMDVHFVGYGDFDDGRPA